VAENGKLSASELSPIPGGQLAHDAAAAWNAKDGPADNGLRPTGSRSSYRLYADQVYFWNHQPPLAAYPGTSNHGWGKAVDLAEQWMRSWIDDHGARFGWKKIEAFSEWWHVNFVGGVGPFKPPFKALKKGMRNRRVRWYVKRLRFIHPPSENHAYFRGKPRRKFDRFVEDAVIHFQDDHGLKPDGVIGIKTAHKISEVFHRQYVARKGKRKRLLRDVIRRRP
jgi:hypothetical protein